MANFIDIAVNCLDQMYQGKYNGKSEHVPDLITVLDRARANQVSKILATGVCVSEIRELLKIGDQYDPSCDFFYITVGVHPTNSLDFTRASDPGAIIDELRIICQQNKRRVRAYGEFGLDRARTSYCPFEIQDKYFQLQLQLSDTLGLPLFLHNRDASDLFYPYLSAHPTSLSKGGVVHSFDGSLDDVKFALDFGLDISVNGCSLRSSETCSAVNSVPVERLHFETDSPWCSIKQTHHSFKYIKKYPTPEGNKPKKYDPNQLVKGRNEPINVRQVAEAVFRSRQSPDHEFDESEFINFCKIVAENSTRLFSLTSLPD